MNRAQTSIGFAIATCAAACIALAVVAQESATKFETVLGGLSNPCGVAVQPETGQVYVADSAAARVIRLAEGKAQDVVTGFPKDVYGKGPFYDIGPLGLVFLDKSTLVVGDGGFKDGEEFLRVYTVPEAAGPALDFEKDATSKSGPLAAAEGVLGEGNLYGLAATKAAVYVTCNGDDTKGWIAKADITGTKLGKLERFIPSKEAVEVDAPVGVTISPRGEIVIGQMGEINKPKDSLLTFYSAKTGMKILNLETGLYDISGLAYSPKTGNLYAVDFAWMATGEGGLFRLDADQKNPAAGLKAVKIASLDKPTAMAFAADGTLYVTVVGPKKEDENAPKEGKLLKFAPGL
jgi:DNA-binding beta-propeller fold protein YncE